MPNVDLIRGTKVYQEAYEEGMKDATLKVKLKGELEMKIELIPKLLKKGMSVQEIAELLELEIEQVTKTSS